MENYIKSLDRASNVFKVLTVFAFFLGLFKVLAVALPSLGFAGMLASSMYTSQAAFGMTAISTVLVLGSEIINTGFIVFCLHTVSLVLEFLAELGEHVHILRRSDWERRQVAAGKTQRMD